MKYGFLGCGNMGGALAKALRKTTSDILITDRSGKAKALAAELDIQYASAEKIAETCDRIFLAVKPHMMADLLCPLQRVLHHAQYTGGSRGGDDPILLQRTGVPADGAGIFAGYAVFWSSGRIGGTAD